MAEFTPLLSKLLADLRALQEQEQEQTRPAGSRSLAPYIRKVISGGQTGADQGGLDAGLTLGLPIGGWCPRGRRSEAGPIPAKYTLTEHHASTYPPRTRKNVEDSDATIIFVNGEAGRASPGSRLTARLADQSFKPHTFVDLAANNAQDQACSWLDEVRPGILNVAGNREEKYPGSQAKVRDILVACLSRRGQAPAAPPPPTPAPAPKAPAAPLTRTTRTTGTKVVNLRREAYDVYIGRRGKGQSGYFGNPFRLNPGESIGATIERYRVYFRKRLCEDPEFKRRVEALRGKRLGCFCKPGFCHGDIIVEWLEAQEAAKSDPVLYQAITPRFVAGIEVENGVVVRAAPILKWAVGKRLDMVERWVAKTGGKVKKAG